MPKASELKRGMVVELNNAPYVLKDFEIRNPSSRGASTLYKLRFANLLTKQKLEETMKSDDVLKLADCERVNVQFSYEDGDNYVFMNTEDYSQYELGKSDLEDQLGFITDGLDGIIALLLDGNIVSIELPQSVELEIVETSPAIKGATASARSKPAILSTGVEIQVPEYIEQGTVVRVNTATKEFMSRA